MNAEGAIVVGVDGSESSMRAVRWAAEAGARRDVGLRIVYAFVLIGGYYGAGLPMPQSAVGELERHGRRILREATATARAVAGELVVTTEMPTEPPIPLLIGLSGKARMVVLGASGRGGFAGMSIGSTATAVAAHARCPVVVVRGDADGTGGPVVVGVDGSPTSERAIAVAFDEASRRRVPLVAVHAWSDVDFDSVYGTARFFVEWDSFEQDEQRLLAQRLAGWQEKYPDVAVERVLVKDQPRHQLLEQAEKAQLIVVGSRGRGGFRGLLLGSTSQALLQHAQCPVMVVRPEVAA